MSETERKVPASSWWGLALLTLVYTLNFLDRTLIYILFPYLKKELHLSDLQLSLLGATAFVIFYTLLGVPFGRLADRVSRKGLIAGGLFVWSLFSGLTAFADSFTTIFLCRVMVGVGEATLGPAALSLLSDYFPPRSRATVSAIYSAGIPLGGGLAFFLGGMLGQELGWRWAFGLLGFPGVLVALLVLALKEPARGTTEGKIVAIATATAKAEIGFLEGVKRLYATPVLLWHHAGYALFALAGNSLSIWGPLFFVRVHGLDIKTIGIFAGILSVAGGIPGTILGGFAADRFRRRGPGGRMLFCAFGALLCIPLWGLLLFSTSIPVLIAVNTLLLAAALLWLGPAAADVHEVAGPELRGLGVGLYFFTAMMAGYGIGPPIVGKLNDLLGVATDPSGMRLALLVSPAACALAAFCLFMGSRAMTKRARALGIT
ncbi:MAG: MFS transporter [Acidobacteria bacterium]|nr:MFS transporter [Acidobacteriota bacterium]